MVVLVTGATGFVGSHLVRRLVESGAEVHVLLRPESNLHRIAGLGTRLHRHDVSLHDRPRLTDALRTIRPRQVFHLAAATMVAGVTPRPEELIRVNAIGAINLIEACDHIDYAALVLTGDSFEYSPSERPLEEDAAGDPTNVHGLSKLAATLFGQAVARDRARPILTLRLFSTYGPGDNPRRLVPRVISAALTGGLVRLSRPEIARDWVFVDDVASFYLEAARKARAYAGRIFNAGSGVSVTIGEIVRRIDRLTGATGVARWGEFDAPAHDATPWVADTAETFAAFQWRPTTSLDEGLLATIQSLKP